MRAIILAAGKGTRLTPMTLNKPKPLLEIRGWGKTILENMIYYLRKCGVDDLIVVNGYKHEMFKPLASKLGFKQIVVDDYETKNSQASLKAAADYIEKGTFVLNGDLYIQRDFSNCIKHDVSQFISQKIPKNTSGWAYITDENFKIIDIDTNATSGYGDGIAFFDNQNDIKILKDELAKCKDNEYWEHIIVRSLDKINIYSFEYDDVYVEIDSFYDALYHKLLTPEEIAIQCSDDGIALRLESMTNVNYKINFLGEQKVIRIPGKGTEQTIDRQAEKNILSLINNLNIAPKSEFYSSDIKMTNYLHGFRNANLDDLNNLLFLELLISNIKKLHSIKLEQHRDFKPILMIDEIRNYERLVNFSITTKAEHKFVLDMARKLDNGKFVLCHRDLLPSNILYNGSEIKLIDFEYAGFSSPIWELGNLSAELKLNDFQILKILELYNKDMTESQTLSFNDIIIGQMLSNYVWALWGWVYDYINHARDYLSRFHKNLLFLESKNLM
ncbi:hypothetical protein LS73_003460 [Helicobacter muridarum]|uniref:Sugar nucleotidyltransferase n=1 Tax=Helicobacter muridarum TaxID=216 RepID=A0A099TY62_9HELI|nr:sugar phosphate nucleotidyltransferase [Helicobacter muridarum]TLE00963.1 hypothetical protein LS73_003460 [Helicobacter muridarum]STQ86752.1 sugar nucleotidyltransferase [Helicobacter muridarum]